MPYKTKVKNYLNARPPGWSKEIRLIAKEPQILINTVKQLIDEGELTNIEFSNDYKQIIKAEWDI